MTSCIASQQQTITGETLKGTLRGKKSCMKFNRAGIFELLSQLRNISYNTIQVNTCIIIAIGMNNAHAEANAPITVRKGPGVTARREAASHDQVELILGIVRSIHVIFGAKAIAMESLTHTCTHPNVAREATCVNSNRGAQADTFAGVVLRGHSTNTSVLQESLLDGMTNTQECTSSNSARSQVLVEIAHIDHACNGWMIVERNFTLWRDKNNFVDGVIESSGNIQRLHVADPASTAGMNGIANFVLAF